MLVDENPIGVVSVIDNLIEDLYVLPEYQGKGYGTLLIKFAITQCTGQPSLWILCNNHRAEHLYTKVGFRRTGNIHPLKGDMSEILLLTLILIEDIS